MQDTLKILGVILNSKLTFKAHIKEHRPHASALRRLRKFNSKDVMVRLYNGYVLPHLEYCRPQLLGIGNVEANKMETLTIIN